VTFLSLAARKHSVLHVTCVASCCHFAPLLRLFCVLYFRLYRLTSVIPLCLCRRRQHFALVFVVVVVVAADAAFAVGCCRCHRFGRCLCRVCVMAGGLDIRTVVVVTLSSSPSLSSPSTSLRKEVRRVRTLALSARELETFIVIVVARPRLCLPPRSGR
jgi:hypothetical protein